MVESPVPERNILSESVPHYRWHGPLLREIPRHHRESGTLRKRTCPFILKGQMKRDFKRVRLSWLL